MIYPLRKGLYEKLKTRAVPLSIKTYLCTLSYTSIMTTQEFRSYNEKVATTETTEKESYKIGPESIAKARFEVCD